MDVHALLGRVAGWCAGAKRLAVGQRGVTLWPKLAITGIAITSALLGGIKLGADHVHAQWTKERLRQAQAQAEYLSRNFVSRSVAEAALSATQARLQAALAKARHEPIQPLPCPPGVDVRTVVLPELADRLRAIRAAGGHDPAADVAPMGSAGPAAADDGGAVRGSAD